MLKGTDLTLKKDSGVLKDIVKEGTGEYPYHGDTVYVHYTGILLDGTKFDCSRERNEQFKFILGKGEVIKGWDIAVKSMKKGEQARFCMKPEYAYGKARSGKIPPNSTLLFDIELLDFHGENISGDVEKSVVKRSLEAGEGYESPNNGAVVEVHLKGIYNDRVFDDRDLTFEIGEGNKHDVVSGIEMALKKCKRGEHALIEINSKYAFGKEGSKIFDILPDSDIKYEIKLKRFERLKEGWQMDGGEKLVECDLAKNRGTEFFKKGNYESAVKKYQRVLDLLADEPYTVDDEIEKARQLKLAANLNLAACYLKTNEYILAKNSCIEALKIDNKNEKGLFRLAQSLNGLNDFEKAIEYFNKVIEINPNNKEAQNLIISTTSKLKDQITKEKNVYSKMFSSTKENSINTNKNAN